MYKLQEKIPCSPWVILEKRDAAHHENISFPAIFSIPQNPLLTSSEVKKYVSTGSALLIEGKTVVGEKSGKGKTDAIPEVVGVDGCCCCPVEGRTGIESTFGYYIFGYILSLFCLWKLSCVLSVLSSVRLRELECKELEQLCRGKTGVLHEGFPWAVSLPVAVKLMVALVL